jgi:hypothetical protein
MDEGGARYTPIDTIYTTALQDGLRKMHAQMGSTHYLIVTQTQGDAHVMTFAKADASRVLAGDADQPAADS